MTLQGRQSPFNNIIIHEHAASMINQMARESATLGKELGGVACYRQDGKDMHVTDFVQMRTHSLTKSAYSFNTNTVRITSDFLCGNKKPFLLHTHPSGSLKPSKQDRLVSMRKNIPGCIVTIDGTACYLGDENIPASRAAFKNNHDLH